MLRQGIFVTLQGRGEFPCLCGRGRFLDYDRVRVTDPVLMSNDTCWRNKHSRGDLVGSDPIGPR